MCLPHARRSWIVIAGTLAIWATPAIVDAQIGGLVKRAARKAADETVANKATTAVARESNVAGDEITSDTLELMFKGLGAIATRLETSEALYKRRDDLSSKLQKHRSANYESHQRYELMASKTHGCYNAFFSDLNQRREGEMQQRMKAMAMSPEKLAQLSQEYARVAMDVQAAQAKGDTAAANIALQSFSQKYLGIDPQADSSAARKTCGAMPPKPASLAEEERLSAEEEALNDQLRQAEAWVELAGPTASGIPAGRFALARERMVMWYQADRAGNADKKFPPREQQLFSSRKSDFDRIAKALR
jgi:hypothetical protein